MIQQLASILTSYFDGKTVRNLRNDEKLPRGFKFLAKTETTGIVSYYGSKYYYTIDNGKLSVRR